MYVLQAWMTQSRANLEHNFDEDKLTSEIQENALAVKVEQSSQRSTRKQAADLKLSATNLRKIVYKELQMHPYNISWSKN